jgi:hypothetical protein
MCCVKSNHITKIMILCTLACMTPEYVFYPTCIRISMCIPIKIFVCLFAISKELQQLQNILLSLLTKEKGFPEITTVSQTYCYNLVLCIVTKSGHTQIKIHNIYAHSLPIFHVSFSELPVVSTSMQLRHYIHFCLMLHTSTSHHIH